MLVMHILRGEVIVDRIYNFFNATWDKRISNADRFSADIVPEYDVHEFDTIIAVEDGIEIGRFKVTAVEPSLTENQEEIIKITAQPLATFYLIGTAIPSASYVKDVTLSSALTKIQFLVSFQHSGIATIEFDSINPSALDPILKETDAQTALEIMTFLCHPSDTRWRCRADLYDATDPHKTIIELGLFGDIQPVYIRSLPRNSSIPNTYGYFSASRIVNIDDFVTDLFADGGRYIPALINYVEGVVDLTWPSLVAPYGFLLTTQTWDSSNVTYLSKLWDKNHNAFTERRWRRIRIDSISPARTGTAPPTNAQIQAASESLLDAAVAYLNIYSEPRETWTVTIPGSMGNSVQPGDKLHVNIVDRHGLHFYDDTIYLISHTINWESSGAVVSTLELSTVLDSMANPLSEDFQAIRANLRPAIEVYETP